MTKSELIERVAGIHGIPRKRSEEVINIIFEKMADALADGDRIEIRGAGSFSLKQHKAYVGRNPKTGEEVGVPAKHSVHFKVGKELREAVENLVPGTENAPE